jgi:hypothetical protein
LPAFGCGVFVDPVDAARFHADIKDTLKDTLQD